MGDSKMKVFVALNGRNLINGHSVVVARNRTEALVLLKEFLETLDYDTSYLRLSSFDEIDLTERGVTMIP